MTASSTDGAVVGIIANPAAGKDIRRLVAQGRVVSNQEKSNTVKRVLAGLQAMGVARVMLMPDRTGIAYGAMRDAKAAAAMRCELLDYVPTGWQIDSTRCAEMMRDAGAHCIVTVGGDGTNRVVAKGSGDVPIAPISTGTNNVFPRLIEGTLAGLAAGAISIDPAARQQACRRACKLDVHVDGAHRDIALVDAAVSRQSMVGARAIWDVANLSHLVLTTARASAIGLSSIGGRLREVGMFEPRGLSIDLAQQASGAGGDDRESAEARTISAAATVRAPIAPGVISDVGVSRWWELAPGDTVAVDAPGCTIALDGEREIELLQDRTATIALNADGPIVVNFDRALQHAARLMS